MYRLSRGGLTPYRSTRAALAGLAMFTLAGVYAPHGSALEPEEPCLWDTHLDAFHADHTTIVAGNATTLHWTVVIDNPACRTAVSVRLVAGSGTGSLVSKQGSQSVSPAQTTTYRLKASYAGQTQWLTPAVTVTVTAAPPAPVVEPPQDSCEADGGRSEPEFCGNGHCDASYPICETPRTCPRDCRYDPCEHLVDTCTTCTRPQPAEDRDVDGIPDRLEYDLAHHFFPAIQLQWSDVDVDASYLARGKALPYTVQPLPVEGLCNGPYVCLEIRYGIAYFTDYGDDLEDTFGFGGHPGDSEFYAVLVQRSAPWSTAQTDVSHWGMLRDFTAAHWGGAADSSVVGAYGFCPAGFSGVTCYESAPRTSYTTLYAAERKHGLYHTIAECNNGGWWITTTDDCPRNRYNMRDWKSSRLQNVGNAAVHGTLDTTIQDPVCGLYDVWSGESFGDATAYKTHFLAGIRWGLQTGGGGGINSGSNRPPVRLK